MDLGKIAQIQYHGQPGGGHHEHGQPVQAADGREYQNYVRVTDINRVLAKVKRLGGKIVMPQEMIKSVGLVVIIRDTEGNGIGIWKLKM